MTTELVTRPTTDIVPMARTFTDDQVDLIKRTLCKGATDDELALFLYTCQRTGLDPMARQIHAVKRRQRVDGRSVEVMTIQTGIDGYRLIADRTNRYAPGREPTFEYDDNGNLFKATAYVKKFAGGTWHEVAASAIYGEYAQMYDGKPIRMWEQMPHNQLAKCAEALALRRAFPADLSGIYTTDEMAQADTSTSVQVVQNDPRVPLLNRIRKLWTEAREVDATWELTDEQVANIESLNVNDLMEYGKSLRRQVDALKTPAPQLVETPTSAFDDEEVPANL